MNSHEVLKNAVDKVGVKKVSAAMNVSQSLVYKWCEKSGEEIDSGARNPLDRLKALIDLTGDDYAVQWLCRHAGGYFVENPQVSLNSFSPEFVSHTRQMLRNFSDLLDEMSTAISDDGRIDKKEAARIRKEWEDLKRYGEQFVHACEDGLFDPEQ